MSLKSPYTERSLVSITKCENYERSSVEVAVHKSLECLGGIGQYVKPNQTVLLKPNVLMGAHPDAAITTHPEVLRAVIKEVQSVGAIAVVGDSPGLENMRSAMDKCKYTEIFEELSVKAVDFKASDANVKYTGKLLHNFNIAKIALEADAIINLPKLKTHGLTTYTGCIKNMFGTICGKEKAQMHVRFQGIEAFSEMLAELYSNVKPVLNIMDGIIAMEGNGPSNGNPKVANVIISGADGVALDTIACKIIGVEINKVPPVMAAYNAGIGQGDILKIDIIGANIEEVTLDDFLVPKFKKLGFKLLRADGAWGNFLKSIATTRPTVNSKCKKCGICVKSCPVEAIIIDDLKNKASIKHEACIRCFCCQELCPHDAINLKTPLIAKFFK